MEQDHIAYLLEKHLAGTLTDSERQELSDLAQSQDTDVLVNAIISQLQQQDHGTDEMTRESAVAAVAKIVSLDKRNTSAKPAFLPFQPGLSVRKWGWAAACALFILAAGVAYFLYKSPSKQEPAVVQATDVGPGANKAVLTLADGSVITLDSAGNRIMQQGNTVVHQQGGQLQYQARAFSGAVSYNTLTTPRGGQFQVRLPDGTKVWLNAASSLRYPTAFTGRERMVEVAGEAYFEVSGNAGLPFRVKIRDQAAVEVLGTCFNINAYNDEAVISTTLLEGRVRVIKGRSSAVLSPNQQAQMEESGKGAIKVMTNVDPDKVVAWKNGLFNFDGAGLEEVMRQIARWYNIEVAYEKGIPDVKFIGKMDRNVSFPVLLKWLQGFDIHFRIENGRRLIITP